jgi:hypothetical protein
MKLSKTIVDCDGTSTNLIPDQENTWRNGTFSLYIYTNMDLTKFGFMTSKKKKTDDHDDEKKKQYETKRERNFQETTRICKKNYDDPLGYICMGLFFYLSQRTSDQQISLVPDNRTNVIVEVCPVIPPVSPIRLQLL